MTRRPAAAAYIRVSTVRQAEGQLSLPDQQRQAEAYCRQHGYDLVSTYEDAATGTDDDRPGLQALLDHALGPTRPLDAIVVHSFSRLFRDAVEFELLARRLEKNGVKLLSITQDLPDDETGKLIRGFLTLFDQYQSRENAKHTLRAMKENTRQGFWNGSQPPLGYTVVDAGTHGARTKRKLAIDEERAPLVRSMFAMVVSGTAGRGPMGVKAIADHLNRQGHRTARGGRFGVKTVHDVLTNPVYKGILVFNRVCAKTGRRKPDDELVLATVPAIVAADVFDRVQAVLASRAPRRAPPQTVGGPTLLAGLARCRHCGGGMVIATGKGGRYRYYVCSRDHRQGKSACPGCRVPAEVLENAVLEAVLDRVLAPARLSALLAALVEKLAGEAVQGEGRRRSLVAGRDAARRALDNLYTAIERGVADLDDPAFAERIHAARRRVADAERAVTGADGVPDPGALLTPANLDRFAGLLRRTLTTGEPRFRRAYLALHVASVTVSPDTVTLVPA